MLEHEVVVVAEAVGWVNGSVNHTGSPNATAAIIDDGDG